VGEKVAIRTNYVSALQRGHTRCILVERVENPTTRDRQGFVILAGAISLIDRPSLAPGVFPICPSPAPGADDYFDEGPRSQPMELDMNCPVCGANAEQIMSTSDGMSVVCPMCGKYDVAGLVIATEQLQRLQPDERDNVLNRAKRLAQPGARPMITANLIATDIEVGEQSAASN
jgi:hypothetical protein